MMLELIKRADKNVKKVFIYKADKGDQWRSSLKAVLEAEKTNDKAFKFIDDCDGLAMTAVEYAIHLGVPKNHLGRAIVVSEGSEQEKADHMLGVFKDSGGVIYFIGDTFGPPCKITQRKHEILYVNWLKDGMDWIKQWLY